ncbi:MAG TPA: hypothetical protein VJW73_15125 [Gemmatimonadaceae bacterium]|nr:hypothetical protein [Gemmatimonadaceae bacterium]
MTARASAARVATFQESSRSLRLLFWIVLPFVVVHVALASISGYRAIVQVYSVQLETDTPMLHPGSTVDVAVATSGRATIDGVLELIQSAHAETVAVFRIPGHTNASYDPRTIRADRRVTLTSEQLARFNPGPARLRAIANGRSQWLRVPPPVIREQTVQIGETAGTTPSPLASSPTRATPTRRTTR